MAHKGLREYTRGMIIKYTGGFMGLEELAARLGSIVPWDMKGNIVLMEDFESEETEWTDESSGGTSSATRSSRHKYSGDWAIKLYVNGDENAYARITRYFHYPGLLKYGLFARFGAPLVTLELNLFAAFYTGSKRWFVDVTYDTEDHTLSVISPAGGKHIVASNFRPFSGVFLWFPVLVTFNLATGYYDKLYFADREYDLSSVALPYTATTAYPAACIEVNALNYVAYEWTAYVDDIIIAKNVP